MVANTGSIYRFGTNVYVVTRRPVKFFSTMLLNNLAESNPGYTCHTSTAKGSDYDWQVLFEPLPLVRVGDAAVSGTPGAGDNAYYYPGEPIRISGVRICGLLGWLGGCHHPHASFGFITTAKTP